MRYTSADFMRIAEAWELQEEGGHRDAVKIIRAALRIASRVMAEGLIEHAMFEFKYNDPPALADAIRAELLEDAT